MNRRKLGSTALELTEISFGAAGIGNLYRAISRDDAMATLDAAWDAGIRYFDTAPHYGQGLSERRLGDFLQGKPRSDFVLSTKVGRLLKAVPFDQYPNNGFVDALPFDIRYDYSHDGIMRSWEASLSRLGMNAIDILYIHDLETATLGADYPAHLRVFLDSGLKALEELKSSGAIGAYGLGVNEVPACLTLMDHAAIDCILLAGRYTLLDRSASDRLLPLCEETGTALVIGGVFNSGILATGLLPGATFNYAEASPEVMERVRQMQAATTAQDVPLAAAALHFPLRHPSVASVLIGTAKPSSLNRNLADYARALPADLWPRLDPLALPQG